jgi:PleD family two-component response regulator
MRKCWGALQDPGSSQEDITTSKPYRIIKGMVNPRVLIVDDDFDIANVCQFYLSGMNLDVKIAVRGYDALEIANRDLPEVIVLDIMLPDCDGYEVCRDLKTNMRTSHMPVIFLTQKDERSDKLQGLELGADDYVTLPFDIEELYDRISVALRRYRRERSTDPRSGLPAGTLIEEQLQRLLSETNWALLDVHINNFGPFREIYGYVAGDDVLRFTGMLIGEVVDECGTKADFIGHASGDHFVIITEKDKASAIRTRLKERYNAEVLTHYNFMDRQNGFLEVPRVDRTIAQVPFMTISAGIVFYGEQSFDTIHELARLAVRANLQD